MKSYSTHIDYIFQVKRIKAILQDWRRDEDSQFECVTGIPLHFYQDIIYEKVNQDNITGTECNMADNVC